MLTTGELEEICKAINKEYGYDSPVCIQFHENGAVVKGDYALSVRTGGNGTLYITNKCK